MPGIIVGVDGSDDSRVALGWAMHEAALRHVPLTVMTVIPAQVRPATRIYWAEPDFPEDRPDPGLVRNGVLKFADTVARELGETAPAVTVTVATGDPAEELVRASHDADMLVVGSRGRGEFAKLLLGSVSSKVVHHATCPVVVIRGARPS